MSDKELMLLAASAAGFSAQVDDDGETIRIAEFRFDEHKIWNPIDSDTDALRLAFHLGFSIERGKRVVHISAMPSNAQLDEDERGDFLAAACLMSSIDQNLASVRRAIVSAAAALGGRQG